MSSDRTESEAGIEARLWLLRVATLSWLAGAILYRSGLDALPSPRLVLAFSLAVAVTNAVGFVTIPSRSTHSTAPRVSTERACIGGQHNLARHPEDDGALSGAEAVPLDLAGLPSRSPREWQCPRCGGIATEATGGSLRSCSTCHYRPDPRQHTEVVARSWLHRPKE